MTVPQYTNTCAPEQVDVTINQTIVQLDGVTAYVQMQSTLDSTLTFSNGERTVVVLDYTPIGRNFVSVYVSGVYQTYGVHWTLNGNVLTILGGVLSTQDLTVIYWSTAPGAAAESITTGMIEGWHDGVVAPDGFLLCDGSAVSRTTYAALFAIIGTTYGTGDGSTTFNLPTLEQAYYAGVSLVSHAAIIKT